MAAHTVHTSLSIPLELYQRLEAEAARQGCTPSELIVHNLEQTVPPSEPLKPRKRLSLDPPIVPSTGKTFDLTNEQIYDLIEFP